MQDARTKELVHSLGHYVKKIITKYPKLKQELDMQLQDYLSTELIEIIMTDNLDKIVEIVKYVPQVVRVENVYAQVS